jgi:hypothetical protein
VYEEKEDKKIPFNQVDMYIVSLWKFRPSEDILGRSWAAEPVIAQFQQ